MAFLKVAQRYKNDAPNNLYHFPQEHLEGWKAFWEAMDGDMDKILSWAKKAGVESPAEWFESLHRFLFDVFVGSPKLLKEASGKTFGEFLKQVAKNHVNDPKPRQWYSVRGVTRQGFVAALERAAEIPNIRQAVAYVNARILDLGFYLYSEYLLSKSEGKSKLKSVASDLNKKAYNIECAALGESPLANLKKGSTVEHGLFPGESLMVVDIVSEDQDIDLVVARDAQGKPAYIEDIWNLRIL